MRVSIRELNALAGDFLGGGELLSNAVRKGEKLIKVPCKTRK